MKRLYFPLIAMTMATPTLCHAYNTWGGADYTDEYLGVTWDKTWTRAGGLQAATTDKAASWMADLPDNMFVAHVSIPGAHDFATGEDNWVSSVANGPASSTTQAVSMREQMDRGIRGIDLRPGLYSNTLYCNHGLAQTEKTLAAAVADMVYFLQQHPSEFFIVHFFRGNIYRSGEAPSLSGLIGASDSSSDQANYNALMKQLFETQYGQYVVEFNPNLTVEQARGKMVLFLRDRIDFVHLDKQARITNWDTNFVDEKNPAIITNELNAELSTKLHVQDISEGDDAVRDTKLDHCKNLINFSQAQKTPNEVMEAKGYFKSEWVMNFTSIDNSGSSSTSDNTNGYKGGASVMNPEIRKYIDANLGRGPLGVFFSDYVLRTSTKKHNSSDRYDTIEGDKLVYSIIANNFTGGEEAPVVRYAIDETKDWNPVTDNPYKGQKFFLRNVGASDASSMYQYFGGGANWGAHAVANYAGHAVEFEAAGGTDVYTFSTTFGKLEAKEKGGDTPYGQYYLDGAGTALQMTSGSYEGRTVYYFTDTDTGKALKAFSYNGSSDYFDRPEYWVDPADYDQNDTFQMWELISYEERLAELAQKGNPDRGMDATFLVPAYSFGNGDSDNSKWTTSGVGKNANTGQTAVWQGGMYRVYNDQKPSGISGWGWGDGSTTKFTVNGSVTGLPKGKYKLYFQALASNQDVSYSINDGTTNRTGSITGYTPTGMTTGANDVEKAGIYFRSSADNGKQEFDLTVTDAGTITLQFQRNDSKTSQTSFYLDNIRLTYYGDNAQPETIKLNFPNEWNTAILPFQAEVPTDLHAYVATGFHDYTAASEKRGSYDVHIIEYDGTPSTQFQANVPYLVNNPNAPKPPHQSEAEEVDKIYSAPTPRRAATPAEEAAAAKVYEFTGYPTNYKNLYNDPNGVLTGTIEGATAAPGHYHLEQTDYAQLFRLNDSDATMTVAANRAYFNKNTGATRSGVYFEEQNVLTGVEDVAAEEQGITDETPVDVYTTGGVMLRHGVAKGEALDELPRGIYILAAGATTLKVAK